MIKVFKLKSIIIIAFVIALTIIFGIGIVNVSSQADIPKPLYTIVIDAGHGGRDDGCSGVRGTKESEINLQISKVLQSYLTTLGINVVMTRCDGNGLYDANVDNYKLSDMNNRLKIIENANADMVISIHQNSYADSSQMGAQVFYQENDDASKNFADSVKSQLISQLPNARSEIIKGDYYLLKESKLPAVIVECGYLTNSEEEKMLNSSEYQNKVAYSIMCGVVKYFDLCGND